jgi:hypothetical protein
LKPKHLLQGAHYRKSWPELAKLDVRGIHKSECLVWASEFARKYSPTAFNNTVHVMRNVFDISIQAGARYENLASSIKRIRPMAKKLQLPSQRQFDDWVGTMEQLGDGWCKASTDLVLVR